MGWVPSKVGNRRHNPRIPAPRIMPTQSPRRPYSAPGMPKISGPVSRLVIGPAPELARSAADMVGNLGHQSGVVTRAGTGVICAARTGLPNARTCRGPAGRRVVVSPGGYVDAVSATRVLMPWQG